MLGVGTNHTANLGAPAVALQIFTFEAHPAVILVLVAGGQPVRQFGRLVRAASALVESICHLCQ